MGKTASRGQGRRQERQALGEASKEGLREAGGQERHFKGTGQQEGWPSREGWIAIGSCQEG
jgi:hypothetical protein